MTILYVVVVIVVGLFFVAITFRFQLNHRPFGLLIRTRVLYKIYRYLVVFNRFVTCRSNYF